MRKTLVCLLAIGFLASCNNNKTPDKNGNIFGPPLTNNNNNTNTNGNTNWSAANRQEFISNCATSAQNGGMTSAQAQSYCSCMQGKLEAKFPNPSDVGKLTAEDLQKGDLGQAVNDCRNNAMGNNNNTNPNTNNPNTNNNNNNNNDNSNGWTNDNRTQFVQGCTGSAVKNQGLTQQAASAYCECITTKIQQRYTFAQASNLTANDLNTPEWRQAEIDCGAKQDNQQQTQLPPGQ